MGEHTAEREFEIGRDESWSANLKRLFDEFLETSIAGTRQNRIHFDKLVSDAQQHDNVRQVTANLALQNAVATADMVAKQALRHADLAVDRQWNVDEVANLVAKSGVQADAIVAAIVNVVARELGREKE